MDIREFAKKIQKAMTEVLGDDYEVKLQEVQKNNGVLLHGLIILAKEQNISPTIYLKPFWEAYEGGVSLTELVRRILEIYREDTPRESIDMSFYREFDKVKDRICYRLINAEQNKALLEKVPHIPFLDLAICFYYAYEGEPLGCGTILIYNAHMEMWRASTAELMRLAQSNTPRLFPWICSSMDVVVRELMQEEERKTGERNWSEEDERRLLADLPMKIISNKTKVFGAASILYPGVLEMLAQKYDSDFYCLPSSVHEFILLLDMGQEKPEHLKEMIAEINRTQVEPEEVLSDSLYYYSKKDGRITQL